MRRTYRFLVGLAAIAQLGACQASDLSAPRVGSVSRELNQPPSVGAYQSGVYRNLFKEWNPSLTDSDIQAKLDQLWDHYFQLGAPETIYFAGDTNADGLTAYVLDTGNNDVRSEGMSYAMMIAVQLDEQVAFNSLWNWAKTYMQHNDGGKWDGYFAWHCSTRGRQMSAGPASDGEEYFATALFFAAHRWGNGTGIYDYESEANRILNTMLHKQDMNGGIVGGVTNMFDASVKQVVFVPYYDSASHTDPSYHLPAFYELWGRWAEGYNGQQAQDRQFWLDAAATSRQFFHWATDSNTGLNPDYAEFDGTAKSDAAGDRQGEHADFRFDAWRTAVNWSVDHAWWAVDPSQIVLSDRLQSFFDSQGITSYGNQYQLDGTPLSTDHSLGLLASNAAASLAASNPVADEFVSELWNAAPATGQYRYYDGMLHMLAMLHTSGNFRIWDVPADPCEPLLTCSGSCVDVSTDPEHCGACGNACAQDATCSAGDCVVSCDPGLESCGGTCIDPQNDPNHCGACDNQCAAGGSCTAGVCQCPAGLLECQAACVDVDSDPEHCGACGNACATGICTNGACQGGAGVFQMQNGEVIMEAEHFAAQETHAGPASWTLLSDPLASETQAIQLLPNVDVTWGSNVEATSPRVDYVVNFSESGSFKFYVRAAGASRDDDAIWVGIDDERIRQALAPSSNGSFNWGSRNVSVDTPGLHTVRLWGFDDGIVVDKIVITNGAAPSGTGPAESPRL